MEVPEFYRMRTLFCINAACILLSLLIAYMCKIGIIDIKNYIGSIFVGLVIVMILIAEIIQSIFLVKTFNLDKTQKIINLVVILIKLPMIILFINDDNKNALWLPIYFASSFGYSLIMPFTTMAIYQKKFLDTESP